MNTVNLQTLQSASTKRSNDALHIDLNTPYGEANRPQMVFYGESEHMPADCAWGIRTVYWLGNNAVILQINGVTLDGLSSKIWTNCYNYGRWTGWLTSASTSEASNYYNKGVMISTDKNLAQIPQSGAYGSAPICINADSSSGKRAGIGLHNEGALGVYLYLENDLNLYLISNDGQKFRINMTAV